MEKNTSQYTGNKIRSTARKVIAFGHPIAGLYLFILLKVTANNWPDNAVRQTSILSKKIV
jgi:hypothetical protein